MCKEYFIRVDEDISLDDYLQFKIIHFTIGTDTDLDCFNYIYFVNDSNGTNQHYYSNTHIYAENTIDNIKKNIATFYNKSNINYGIEDLLNNTNYIGKMKIKAAFTKKLDYDRWELQLNIYILKEFLLNTFSNTKIPTFLFRIILDEQKKNSYFMSIEDIKNNSYILENRTLHNTYKRELFIHQKNNIFKMIDLENNDNNNLELTLLPSNYNIYNINEINEKIICDNKRNVLDYDSLDKNIYHINGGILCDKVGLGKTTTMIGLISETKHLLQKPSLLICPSRLCKQWIEEIDKTYDLKYKLISNISQFKKMSIDQFLLYDIIIISYNFLINNNYQNYCLENLDNLNSNKCFHNYDWKRIILDEGHEYISSSIYKKKTILKLYEQLLTIKNGFKWICSGTPYNNINDLEVLLKFTLNSQGEIKLKTHRHNLDLLLNKIFIKENNDSLLDSIPKPNIETVFLNMTQLERQIYDTALDDKNKQIELCNHIMVSDEHISILGNQPLSLDEIHIKMTEYYNKKINYIQKRLINIDNDLNTNLNLDSSKKEELIIKKNELTQDLINFNTKLNIFNNIQQQIEDTEDCPICMVELKDLTKTMTPCGHLYCANCINHMKQHSSNNFIKCAICRHPFQLNDLSIIKDKPDNNHDTSQNVLGTKLEYLLNLVKNIIQNSNDKIIIFSQWDNFIKLVSKVFTTHNINNIFINGSVNTVSSKIKKFKLDNTLNVVFISSDKSPSGLNLQEASHIILLDSLNTEKSNAIAIEEQAIARAVRIGQTKQVQVKRLIMRNTIEHDFYLRNNSTN